MIERVRPPKGTVVALRPETLSVAEQQMIARKRARTDIPTKQRDFSEVWGKERPRKKPRVA
jgi:hypothetical protein